MRITRPLLIILLVSIMGTTELSAMTIEEAYRAIPHRRTVFDINAAKMPGAEKQFLKEFFHLADLATVQRVETLIELQHRREAGQFVINYDKLLTKIRSLSVPSRLKEAHRLVISAIEDQRDFLSTWQEAGPLAGVNVASHPQVKKASNKLIQAYNILMKTYPQENAHNKQAFFDYLCALDFI